MNTTLLLDTQAWDLVLDAGGNIALATAPYAVAQDVASALRLFLAECYYDDTRGVPYFEEILGHTPPIGVFQEYMTRAALTVPGVVSAQCEVTGVENRTISGQVTFRLSDGSVGAVGIAPL